MPDLFSGAMADPRWPVLPAAITAVVNSSWSDPGRAPPRPPEPVVPVVAEPILAPTPEHRRRCPRPARSQRHDRNDQGPLPYTTAWSLRMKTYVNSDKKGQATLPALAGCPWASKRASKGARGAPAIPDPVVAARPNNRAAAGQPLRWDGGVARTARAAVAENFAQDNRRADARMPPLALKADRRQKNHDVRRGRRFGPDEHWVQAGKRAPEMSRSGTGPGVLRGGHIDREACGLDYIDPVKGQQCHDQAGATRYRCGSANILRAGDTPAFWIEQNRSDLHRALRNSTCGPSPLLPRTSA